MNLIRISFCILILSMGATLSPATIYRTNIDQSGPPPGCFESPTHRYTVTNPANSGQIWDLIIRTHHWVNGSGWSGGYYTNPVPTGEVVRLMPGDSAFLWHARGYQTVGGSQIVGINWSETSITQVSVMAAPTIAWTNPPGTVASGQGYTVAARGHDADGNLTQVNIWKDGQPFAFAGGGNGTDGDSNNPTSDIGPKTVIFTAQSVDATGATSPMISQTVTISAPANRAPTISWTSPPGTVGNGQWYTVSAHGHDADGNLTEVNIWKNGQPFAFAGGSNGTDGDSHNPTNDIGPRTVTFTAQSVDATGATSPMIFQVVTISAPANQAPTISWTSQPGTVADGQSYTVSAHGHDTDGNLTEVKIWKDGQPFAFAGGGNGTDGDSYNPSIDTGPQNITFSAQAVDSSGATSATISQTVTVTAPPPAQFNLTTIAEPGGAVSAGGTYTDGTTANVTATPDPSHEFSGWTGDTSGTANPLTVTMNRDRTVRAHFTLRTYELTTQVTPTGAGSLSGAGTYDHGETASVTASPAAGWRFSGFTGDLSGATPTGSVLMNGDRTVTAQFVRNTFTLVTQADSGGTVSPGGTYPEGTTRVVTAAPDAQHDFIGWAGDAAGSNPSVGVLIDGPKTVRAQFALKQFALTTTATSGGTVTPGGSYPLGTVVTIHANASTDARFVQWEGDANGTNLGVAVTMDGPKSVLARFAIKAAQTISFQPPPDASEGMVETTLNASADSGLVVTYVVLSGPATVNGNRLFLTGPGPVSVQAVQAGNEEYLPAPPVTRSFNVVAPAIVKYAGGPRTLLQVGQPGGLAPIILERP